MGFFLPPFGREPIRFLNSANYNVFKEGWQHDRKGYAYEYVNTQMRGLRRTPVEYATAQLNKPFYRLSNARPEYKPICQSFTEPCSRDLTGQAANSWSQEGRDARLKAKKEGKIGILEKWKNG
jgi:hypothetical protein